MKSPTINKNQPILIFSKSMGTIGLARHQDTMVSTYNLQQPNKGIWVEKLTVENVKDLQDLHLYEIYGTTPHREENEKEKVLAEYPFEQQSNSYTVEINKFLRQINGEGWNDIILKLSSLSDAPFQAHFYYEVVGDHLERFYLSHNNTTCEFTDTVNPVFRNKGVILEKMGIHTTDLNDVKLLITRGGELIEESPLTDFLYTEMGENTFHVELRKDISHISQNQWKDITVKLVCSSATFFKAEVFFTTVPNSFSN
jgi:hypothetical protein